MWHGRLRPISGELPKGTYKFIRRTTVEYPTMAVAYSMTGDQKRAIATAEQALTLLLLVY
jgi:hypothetical protein